MKLRPAGTQPSEPDSIKHLSIGRHEMNNTPDEMKAYIATLE